jgi:hypothetical protein
MGFGGGGVEDNPEVIEVRAGHQALDAVVGRLYAEAAGAREAVRVGVDAGKDCGLELAFGAENLD